MVFLCDLQGKLEKALVGFEREKATQKYEVSWEDVFKVVPLNWNHSQTGKKSHTLWSTYRADETKSGGKIIISSAIFLSCLK